MSSPRTGKDKRFREKALILSMEKPGEEGFPAGQAKQSSKNY